jgi:tRNA-dihydrouridine synthase B
MMIHAENLGGGLSLGEFKLAGKALLAPMAGSTDAGLRGIAQRYGASAAFSEMVTAGGLAREDRETRLRLAGGGGLGPRVIQIAARGEDDMALAARRAADAGADWIDINMGCPCKRVTGGLAGAALMRDLDQARRLIAAAVGAVAVPVSVKMRLGWDDASRNAPELARRAEAEGAKLVTVHGRTRQQFYKGAADWIAIAAVKTAVGIPVVANGDCDSPQAAAKMLRASGADAVMIGRAALGQPWLVGDVAHYLATGRLRAPPPPNERLSVALEHFESLCIAMGAGPGLRHARKHLAAYIDRAGLEPTEARLDLRRALLASSDPREVGRLLRRLLRDEPSEVAA